MADPAVDLHETPMTADQVASLRTVMRNIEQMIGDGLTFETAVRTLQRDLQALAPAVATESIDRAEWARGLEEMANDPDIQREIRAIEAESSGLGAGGPEARA